MPTDDIRDYLGNEAMTRKLFGECQEMKKKVKKLEDRNAQLEKELTAKDLEKKIADLEMKQKDRERDIEKR